jgi:hypothetical protein
MHQVTDKCSNIMSGNAWSLFFIQCEYFKVSVDARLNMGLGDQTSVDSKRSQTEPHEIPGDPGEVFCVSAMIHGLGFYRPTNYFCFSWKMDSPGCINQQALLVIRIFKTH